ncbi:SRPBCC domain-containing protein [bacterium]|nr:SRPBCC domain-containing protein [bacterium]
MKNELFVIERTYSAPIERVWLAITKKEQMKKWYFDIAEFRAEIGFEFQFYGGPPEKQYLHLCKIIEVIEYKKLAYSWRYDGYEGNSIVAFELSEEGNSTHVKLSHANLETFPISNPDFAKENFAAGWTDIIGRSLKEFVESSSNS